MNEGAAPNLLGVEADEFADTKTAKKTNGKEAPSDETISIEIAKLAKMGPIEYDKSRQLVADMLEVSVSSIDQEVKIAKRAKADVKSQLLFPEINACTDIVEGGRLPKYSPLLHSHA